MCIRIAYFSNFLNHHQKLVADELCKILHGNFTFVETVPMYDWLKKGGYEDYSDVDYVLCAWESDEKMQEAIELARSVDVALFGGPEVLFLEVLRAKETDKLSFEVSERWFKKGGLNLLSPRLIKSQWYYHTLFYKKPIYKLCASAFCANDQYKLHSFVDKCFKWGYFTKVEKESTIQYNTPQECIKLMWCSRFLRWKHPELPIYMSKILKEKGYKFNLDMYGSGNCLDRIVSLAKKMKVCDVVNFCGNVPNDEILQAMKQHHIFLFTSDRNEGWGAVANEAMSNGCVLVGADAIGSLPYLVKDGQNGLLFKSSAISCGVKRRTISVDEESLISMCSKVEFLINHPNLLQKISRRAYATVHDIWSPSNAAHNLIELISALLEKKDTPINDGPCSKALPL